MDCSRTVVEVLDQSHPYVFRGILLRCLRLRLSCGHEAIRNRYKNTVACLECYHTQVQEKAEAALKMDPTGQILMVL